jgi:hypothetical protein
MSGLPQYVRANIIRPYPIAARFLQCRSFVFVILERSEGSILQRVTIVWILRMTTPFSRMTNIRTQNFNNGSRVVFSHRND